MRYFDERTLYTDHKRPSWRKMALWCIGGIIFGFLLVSCGAQAQTKVKEGQVVTTTTILCNTVAEASKALSILHDAGREGVEVYAQGDDNTCTIGVYRFVVGPTVGLPQNDPDGVAWTVITVHPPADPSQTDYVLAKVSALDLASY